MILEIRKSAPESCSSVFRILVEGADTVETIGGVGVVLAVVAEVEVEVEAEFEVDIGGKFTLRPSGTVWQDTDVELAFGVVVVGMLAFEVALGNVVNVVFTAGNAVVLNVVFIFGKEKVELFRNGFELSCEITVGFVVVLRKGFRSNCAGFVVVI